MFDQLVTYLIYYYMNGKYRISAGVVNGADLKSAGLWPQRFESSLIRFYFTHKFCFDSLRLRREI